MIKLANEKDVFGIYSCIKDAKRVLKEKGSDQWQDTDGYPNMETVMNYVSKREMYVNIENNQVIGCVALCRGSDISYSEIDGEWLNNDVYYTIHLMAVKEEFYHKGVGQELIKEVIKVAYREEIYNLRVDTKLENEPMCHLLGKCGFIRTGVIEIKRDGVIDPKREAYQLVITKEVITSLDGKKEDTIPVKKTPFKSLLDYIIKTMNGMAYGLFSTLIIGTIIATIGGFIPEGNIIREFLLALSNILKLSTGLGIGLGIAWSLKLEGLKMISACVAGGIASCFSKVKIWELIGVSSGYFAEKVGFAIGDPLSIYVVVIGTILLMNLVLRKKTPVDILIIPLFTLITAGIISVVVCGPVSYLTTLVGNFVNEATYQQPLVMGILIAVVMGMALTAPISSAAIAASLGLSGIAGGASVIGCCVQMLGFSVMSRKDNNIGTVISVGIGTSMLQFKNILRKPLIWLPTIIVSAILGPLGTMLFELKCNSSGAGMGTSGLVGIFGTIAEMGGIGNSWLAIVLLLIVGPIVLVYFVDIIFRKLKWIKSGDLTI